jgi:hypothetical protein
MTGRPALSSGNTRKTAEKVSRLIVSADCHLNSRETSEKNRSAAMAEVGGERA